MKVILTSAESKHMVFAYRLPNGQVDYSIDMPAYTLNKEFSFPNEECFNAFKKQNAQYLLGDHPKLIIGTTTGSKAEKIHNANKKIEGKELEEKLESETGIIVDSAEQNGISIQVDVEKNAPGEKKGHGKK